MTSVEQAPAKDWRQVERERVERQRVRANRLNRVLWLPASVVWFAVAVIMLVTGPDNFFRWLMLVQTFLSFSMSYSWWRSTRAS